MKARGKREAQLNESPLVNQHHPFRALKGRNTLNIRTLQALYPSVSLTQGRRFHACPGFLFRAFGAAIGDFLCKA